MKTLLIIVCSFLASCAYSDKTAKANKIINTSLEFSVRHGIITEEDAQSAKDINKIVLPSELSEVTVETTSGK